MVWNASLPIHLLCDEILRKSLIRAIRSRNNDKYRHTDPPQGEFKNLFESRFDFLQEVSEPSIKQLSIQIDAHLNAFLAVVTGSEPQDIDMKSLGCESWFHITTHGGYFQPHHHPNASWSVVYCVDNGFSGHAFEFEESGHLIFIDPRNFS